MKLNFKISKKHFLVFFLIISTIIISCKQKKEIVTNPNDYNKFFEKGSTHIDNIQKRIGLLNTVIKKDSLQIIEIRKISREYSMLFDATGQIEYLKKAEQALLKALNFGGLREDRILLDLARNCISQHRFKDAEVYAKKSYDMYPNKASKLVLFDVYLELGETEKAYTFLNDKEVFNINDFDYLIRFAKWNDHQGNMKAVLHNMEAATKIAVNSKNKYLINWSYTNLATYYGHAGKIKESYEYFIKALELNKTNAFAKKSIAWIIYSYENNPKEATRIMEQTIATYKSPDLYLFMADLFEAQNELAKSKDYKKLYEEAVKDYRYGNMYNAVNAIYLAENKNKYEEALKLSQLEIKERATPKVYGLHAYVLKLKGDNKKALQIIEKQGLDKISDPITNYYVAEIYKSNNLPDKVKSIKEDLQESSFELGPTISQKIVEL